MKYTTDKRIKLMQKYKSMVDDGHTIKEALKFVGVNHATMRRWLENYRTEPKPPFAEQAPPTIAPHVRVNAQNLLEVFEDKFNATLSSDSINHTACYGSYQLGVLNTYREICKLIRDQE